VDNNLSVFDLFLIDIETVPQVSDRGQLPDNLKKLFADKISKTVPENYNANEVYDQKAGILAEFGKVICISTAFFFKDKGDRICLKIKSLSGHDEADLLRQFVTLTDKFYSYRKKFFFAGHNIREFDIPFLCRRMVINNIQLPTYLHIYGAKPWEIMMVDTMQWWKFGDHKNYTSLHLLASILDIPTSKDDIDGSMVQHVYYKENGLQRIVEYCEKDVIVVARLIQRLKNMPVIKQEYIFKSV
jgi:hypothetical protein